MNVNRNEIEKEVKSMFFYEKDCGTYVLKGGIYYYDIVDYVVEKLKQQS